MPATSHSAVSSAAFTPADSPRRFRVVEVSHVAETDCLIEPPDLGGDCCDYEQDEATTLYERADAFRVAAERNAAGGHVGWFCVVEMGRPVARPAVYANLASSGLGVEEMTVQTPVRLAVPNENEQAAYRLVVCEG